VLTRLVEFVLEHDGGGGGGVSSGGVPAASHLPVLGSGGGGGGSGAAQRGVEHGVPALAPAGLGHGLARRAARRRAGSQPAEGVPAASLGPLPVLGSGGRPSTHKEVAMSPESIACAFALAEDPRVHRRIQVYI